MPEPLLELENVACERDDRLLFSQLNAVIHSGDIWQIAGPNGSGKTSLLRLITGMAAVTQGDIRWCGQPVAHVREDFLSNLLYIGHLPGIKKALTARENLIWLHSLANCVGGGEQQPNTVLAALADVGLAGYEDFPCYQMSAGQQRRVSLARMHFSRAALWVLDEPFTAIDKQGVARLEAKILAHAQRGGAVIFTTHQTTELPNVQRLDLADYQATGPEEVLL